VNRPFKHLHWTLLQNQDNKCSHSHQTVYCNGAGAQVFIKQELLIHNVVFQPA